MQKYATKFVSPKNSLLPSAISTLMSSPTAKQKATGTAKKGRRKRKKLKIMMRMVPLEKGKLSKMLDQYITAHKLKSV